MTSLEGKAIVVTGGGRGIGAAYVQHFAGEGARVLVNDISQEAVDAQVRAVLEAGGVATGFVADISDPDAAAALIDECVCEFGHIDGLVNNAGVMFVGPATDLDADRVRTLFAVNVLGSIFCGVPAMRRMMAQGFGSIVNVTSGAHMGLGDTAVYGASKGAIASLTYDWATDVRGTGVRVNAVSPMAGTQMAADVLTNLGVPTDLLSERLASFPEPALNAPVVAFLLSDLSIGLNGQIVRIDGEELAVVSRPAIVRPSVTSPAWTVELVADAFERVLAPVTMPVGLLQLEGDYRFSTLREAT